MGINQHAIFAPFLTMMVLTFAVWLYMYARRIPFIIRSKLTAGQMMPLEFARLSPPSVSNPSDNLKNLFEIPTLFYALILYLFATDSVDSVYLVAAWVFVGFRVLHSTVHCTINIVVLRFWLYAISTITLWLMIGRAVIRG